MVSPRWLPCCQPPKSRGMGRSRSNITPVTLLREIFVDACRHSKDNSGAALKASERKNETVRMDSVVDGAERLGCRTDASTNRPDNRHPLARPPNSFLYHRREVQ